MPDETPGRSRPDFGRWLHAILAASPEVVTWKALAERAGLSYSYLIQIKNGHSEPTPRAIAALEAALGHRYLPPETRALTAPPMTQHRLEREFHLVPVVERICHDSPFFLQEQFVIAFAPLANAHNPRRTRFFLQTGAQGSRSDPPVPGTGSLVLPSAAWCLVDPEQVTLSPGSGLYVASVGESPAVVCTLEPPGPPELRIFGRVEEVRYRIAPPDDISGLARETHV